MLKNNIDDFISLLNKGFFDEEEYLMIENKLLNIASVNQERLILEKDVFKCFYDFISSISSMFFYHTNDNDIFEFENIDAEKLKNYKDRCDFIMEILLGRMKYSDVSCYFE